MLVNYIYRIDIYMKCTKPYNSLYINYLFLDIIYLRSKSTRNPYHLLSPGKATSAVSVVPACIVHSSLLFLTVLLYEAKQLRGFVPL